MVEEGRGGDIGDVLDEEDSVRYIDIQVISCRSIEYCTVNNISISLSTLSTSPVLNNALSERRVCYFFNTVEVILPAKRHSKDRLNYISERCHLSTQAPSLATPETSVIMMAENVKIS